MPSKSPTADKHNMQNASKPRLRRSPGTISFAQMMASANEEGFPLADRELDSDSDDSAGSEVPLLYTQSLDAIAEEDVDANDGFAKVVDYETPKYCCDPNSSIHPD